VARPLTDQLAELSGLLEQMCTAATTALQDATVALLDGRERLAVQVISRHAGVEEIGARAEQLASQALLLRSPVAGDLRSVVGAIRCVGDAERMSKLAVHVARAAQRRRTAVAAEVAPALREMDQCAVALGHRSAEVVRTRNVVLAVQMQGEDDAMDELHRRMFSVMMHPSWPHGIAGAVEVTMLARYYERFADHAVKIARLTVYAVTGQEPEAVVIP